MFAIFFLLLIFSVSCFGQQIFTSSSRTMNLRSFQLIGKADSLLSFSMRPTVFGNSMLPPDSATADSTYKLRKGNLIFYKLPLTVTQQYNTHHPYGWNDGAMIAANGYQTLASTGVYVSLGPLTIQLKPEFLYASNPSYEHSSNYGADIKRNYIKFLPGESMISVSSGKLSVGLSSASMWWGPGVRSSLLMSNNAPGFTHLFFQTRKPVKTAIGSFEWQIIGGWLSSDDNLGFENDYLLVRSPPTPTKTRYINGLTVSYQPRWIPGLFVGVTRAIQVYAKDSLQSSVGIFEKYLPVLALAVQKKNVGNEDIFKRDQLASIFLRWIFQKANAEIYFEYGLNDYGVNLRDYLMGPSHSAAYIAGVRKIIPKEQNKRIELGIELTQMSQSPDWMVRNAGNWYEHGQLREGYTNQNQIMGSGAGFGANVLSFDITWVNGWKRLGFLLERIDRDPVKRVTKWIDIGIGILPEWQYKQFLISGMLEVIKTKNYIWQKDETRFNMHTQLSIQYNF